MFIKFSLILFYLMVVAGFFQLIGLFFIVAGAMLTFYGWKFRSLLVAVTGFIVGGGIGTLIDSMFNTSYFGYGSIVLSIFSAFLGVAMFLTLENIAVGASIGSIGALLLWTATGTPVAGIIGFIIAAYLGWKFYNFSNIVIYSTTGAILISVGGLIAGLWSLDFSWVIVLCIIIMGIIIQYRRKTPSPTGSEPSEPSERDFKQEIRLSMSHLRNEPYKLTPPNTGRTPENTRKPPHQPPNYILPHFT